MTDIKTQPNRNNINTLTHTREARPQFTQDRSRYILISQHQPDQAPCKTSEQTLTTGKAELKLAEATQGIKQLQEKIDSALTRSLSATSIRSQQNAYGSPLGSALHQNQYQSSKFYHTEATNETMESFYDPRARVQTESSYQPTVKKERVVNFNAQTPQASSRGFYLEGMNPNGKTKEELLNSIKNYQVKTINTLNSSRNHYSSQNTTQNISERNHGQKNAGPPVMQKNLTVQAQFQPGYDKAKPDLSKIASAYQNYASVRQDSFVKTANVSYYQSHSNSKVYESRVPQQQSREMPQQCYYARPLQAATNKAPPAQVVYQKQAKERNAPARAERSMRKKSNIGEIQSDGDSMICDFLKENDDLLDFEEEVKPEKKTRYVDPESQLVRKVPRKQEAMDPKKRMKKEPNHEQAQRQREEISSKSNGSELIMKNKRRI